MPIIGLTDRGAQFPRIGELRKGAPKTGNKPGADLKHFRFTSTNVDVVKSFAQFFGNDPDALRVFLPYETTDENFEAWREEWGAGSLKHRCDGVNVHIMQENGVFFHPNMNEPIKCPGGCKQVGRLKVIIPELQRFAYVVALTTSTHDILELTANLRAYEAARGSLQGIPFILSRVPRMVSTPSKNGRVRREKWLLHIEAAPEWVAAQLSVMQHAALPGATGDTLMIESGEPDFDVDDDGVMGDYPDSLDMSAPSDLQKAIDSSLGNMTPEERSEVLNWDKPPATKGHDMTPPSAEKVAMWRGKVANSNRLKMITLAGMVANAVPYFDNDHHVMNYADHEKDAVFLEPDVALAEFDRLVTIGTEKANA